MGQRRPARGRAAQAKAGAWPTLLAALLLPATAAAVPVEDRATSFLLELEIPDAEVCIAYPTALRDDDACEGVNVEVGATVARGFEQRGGRGLLAASVKYLDWRAEVLVTYFDSGMHPWTHGLIENYVKGFSSGFAAGHGVEARVYGNEPGTLYSVIPIRGRPVIHFTMDVDVPPSHRQWPLSRIIVFAFVSRGRVHMVMTYAPPDHGAEHGALALRLARSVSLPETTGDIVVASREARLALRLAAVIGPIVLGAIVWVLVVTGRNARRSRNRAAPLG